MPLFLVLSDANPPGKLSLPRSVGEPVMRILNISFFFTACVLMAVGQQTNDSELLETGRSAKLEKLEEPAKQISIVTYNIRWRTGDELTKIADWLKGKRPTVIALQEVDRSKQRTKQTN